MKLSLEEMKRRRVRLKEAIDKKFDGSSDALGKALGHQNGGFIRQMLNESGRAITEKTIAEIEALDGMKGWFGSRGWPFEQVSQTVFETLTEREKGAVEDAMLEKIDAILSRKRGHSGPHAGGTAQKDKAA